MHHELSWTVRWSVFLPEISVGKTRQEDQGTAPLRIASLIADQDGWFALGATNARRGGELGRVLIGTPIGQTGWRPGRDSNPRPSL